METTVHLRSLRAQVEVASASNSPAMEVPEGASSGSRAITLPIITLSSMLMVELVLIPKIPMWELALAVQCFLPRLP